MTKQELVAVVAKETGLSSNEAKGAVEATIASIKEAVERGEAVYLRGFGTFQRKHRAAKVARNISRNTPIVVPARDVPHFKPSKGFTLK